MTQQEAREALRAAGKSEELIERYVTEAEAQLGVAHWTLVHDPKGLQHDFELWEAVHAAT